VNVPAAAEVRQPVAAVKPTRPASEIGEYSISEAPRGAEAGFPGMNTRRKRRSAVPNADSLRIRVECNTCRTAIDAIPQARDQTIVCPECAAPVRIPAADTAAKWHAAPIAPRVKEEIGEFTALPPSAGAKRSMQLFDVLGAVRREEEPPPPNWTFFSGVFSFPWRVDVRMRWVYMSFGLVILSLFAAMGRTVLGGVTGGGIPMGGGVALAFFALPMIWLVFWSASYSAACFLTVLEETAGGNDRVLEWPEPHWKEWFARLIFLMWVSTYPLVLSFGIAKLSEVLGGPFWPVMGLCGALLFPVNLLSALDASSPWVPFTGSIVLSVFRVWWAWLTVLILSACLWSALIASLIAGSSWNDFLPVLWTGPLLAAVILIEARLLGRLVWRASTPPESRRGNQDEE
jgi:hypothetical protein